MDNVARLFRARKNADLSLAHKLTYSFVIVNVVLIALGVLGILNLKTSEGMSNSIVGEQLLPLESLTQIQNELRGIQVDLYKTIASPSPGVQITYYENIQNLQQQINDQLKNVRNSQISTDYQKQWLQFVTSLSNSEMAVSNDFSQIQSAQYRNSPVHITSSSSVNQAVSDLGNLVSLEMKSASTTVQQSKDMYAQSLWTSTAVILIALLLSMVLAAFMIRSTVRPIHTVTMELEHLARSNGDLTKRLQVRSRDEIGRLASAFNEMINSIQNIVQALAGSTDQMVATSEGLAENSNRIMQSSIQISERAQEISSGSAEQRQATETVVELVHGVSENMESLRRSSLLVAQASSDSQSSVETGYHALERTVGEIMSVSESINQLGDNVNRLGQKGQQIASIVQLITGIADQSRLLSLNATIEAARVGESGQAFAVVAQEMRSMAQRSKDAAVEIRGMAELIESEMKSVANQMLTSKSIVADSANAMKISSNAFGEIRSHVELVHQRIQESLQSIEKMDEKICAVQQSTELVQNLAEGFADNTQDVAAATEEQAASVEETAAFLDQFKQNADALKALIGQFTY